MSLVSSEYGVGGKFGNRMSPRWEANRALPDKTGKIASLLHAQNTKSDSLCTPLT
ncbi:hypothetical protein FHS27_004478 [Rhodopirellula rubra]|uniref:Uncharacterized protein n=1 Tax=Aporhodopirellula rubra TaxID=980271 RepID=A0A7W5E1V3_9BACT|nr:hypothetical protein [Aporhodopirellula rubra]